MKAVLLHENLEPYVSIISKSLPSTSPVPVLLNILIEATEKGLFISATDLELGVKIKIPAKIEKTGALTVPGRQFVEVMSSILSRKITLSQTEQGLLIEAQGGRAILQTIPKEEFPNLFEEKGEKIYSFKEGELKRTFSKLLFAVSLDGSRPELGGIYAVSTDAGIDFVATDGFRLSLKRIKGKKILKEGKGIILSAKLANEAMGLKNDTVDVYLHEEANQILFETQDIIFVGRLIHGSFPNYEKVLPKRAETTIIVNKEDFLGAIKLSSVFARESANIAKVSVQDNVLKIAARSSGIGEGEARVDVVQVGKNTDISFNVKFLIDLMKSIDDKEVIMELNSAVEPAVFKTSKDPEFLHVIMPVRVQE